jgi:hypothetical protein
LGASLSRRQQSAGTRYPLISYAVVPSEKSCEGAAVSVPAVITAGPWGHVEAPRSVPDWVPCSGFASLITYDKDSTSRVAARAVVWPRGLRGALVVDIPFSEELIREFHDEMGISIEGYTGVDRVAEKIVSCHGGTRGHAAEGRRHRARQHPDPRA